jgi:YVTN family beta-propeller protein
LNLPAVITTIALGNNGAGLRDIPMALAVNAATNQIYVVSGNDQAVSIIDGATNTLVPNRIALSSTSPVYSAAADAATNRIYFTEYPGVQVVDGATNSLIGGRIIVSGAAGITAFGLGVDESLNRIYVTGDQISGHVAALEGPTNAVMATLPGGNMPYAVAVNGVTQRFYVANFGDSTLTVIDAQSNTIVGSPIHVGIVPVSVAVNSRTNRVYIANSEAGTVSVIDGATNSVIGTPIAVGPNPRSVAVNEITDRIYVANAENSTVVIVDGATGQLVGSPIPVGAYPYSLAVAPTTGLVYVANMNSSSVSVIEDK